MRLQEDFVTRISTAAVTMHEIYLVCLNLYADRSIDAAINVLLLVDVILNTYCKRCICQSLSQ